MNRSFIPIENMHWLRLASIITFALTVLDFKGLGAAEDSPDRYDYQEVLDLLKSQLPDLTEQDLENAAARGLLRELEPRVRLVVDEAAETSAARTFEPTAYKVYDEQYGYVRWTEFHDGMAEESTEKLRQLVATNQLNGLVVDLRFATGDSYADAARLADMFYGEGKALIDWGKGVRKSTAKTDVLELPVAVLTNGETAEAAEALAAMLRGGHVGLVIGAKTAGRASMYREFHLTTGQRLRIATEPIKVGEEVALSPAGVSPDIRVAVPEVRERLWLDDPYKLLTVSAGEGAGGSQGASGDTTPRRHLNEADLVRMLREGEIPDLTLTPSEEDSVADKPVIRDPALARALDFLKGLAVVRKFRSN